MPRVLISINAAWNVVNFRSGLVRALVEDGHEVSVAVPDDQYKAQIEALGAKVIPLPMTSRSMSVAGDALLFLRYIRLFRRLKPEVFLGWTVKPNIYGSLAARLCGVARINNISGLGTAFLHGRWLRLLVQGLYGLGLRRSTRVFFQNVHDRALFLDYGMITADQGALLPGSGIDTRRFRPSATVPDVAEPQSGSFRFLMIARLIRDKGIYEYVAAAKTLRMRRPDVRCQLLGACDVDNRTAVDIATLQDWVDQGLVDYLGEAEDVRPHLSKVHCVVLPSYREGLSRVLLEAGAMERPTITSDVPGCRDAVVPNVTGLLCMPRDEGSLLAAMEHMLAMGDGDRRAMGQAARAHVSEYFAESSVIDAYRSAIGYALSKNDESFKK